MHSVHHAHNSGGGPILPEIKLAITLRWLCGGSYLDIVDNFMISESTFYPIIFETMKVLDEVECISFPRDKISLERASEGFGRRTNGVLDGCVGALDGWAPRLQRPRVTADCPNPSDYYSRKGFYTLNVQAMCDANRRFVFVSMVSCGAVHDSTAFALSRLSTLLEEGKLPEPYWIAGDQAYPLSDSLLTPFGRPRRGPMDPASDAFNFFQSSARMNIECAFGMLVQRFGVFWRPLRVNLDRVPLVIRCAMKIHNLCIDQRMDRISLSMDADDYKYVTARRKTEKVGGVPDVYRAREAIDDEAGAISARARAKRAHNDRRDALATALHGGGFRRPPSQPRNRRTKKT